MFLCELSGCGFESRRSHLNFRFRACFEQGVSWHSGNYSVWIQSETRAWHQNIKLEKDYFAVYSHHQEMIICTQLHLKRLHCVINPFFASFLQSIFLQYSENYIVSYNETEFISWQPFTNQLLAIAKKIYPLGIWKACHKVWYEDALFN